MGERGNELYKDLPRSGMHSAALWPVLSGSGRLGDPTGLDARHRAGRRPARKTKNGEKLSARTQ